MNCELCGRELRDGDKAVATTTGSIDMPNAGGFLADDNPWLEVFCTDCYDEMLDRRGG